MKFNTRTRTRGFTFLEALVTIAVYGLVIGAITSMLVALITQSRYRNSAITSIDQSRVFGKQFVNELRNAQSGNDGSYALGQASSTQIIFFSPYGSGSASIIERIRYYVASSTLYKGVTVPTGTPLSYNTATENVTPIIRNLSVGTSSPFTYYDGSYAGTSSPLTQPVNVTQVKYVKINLTVYQQAAKNASSTYVFTAGGSIRSLKSNLGN